MSAAGAEEFAWGGDDATLASWASGAERIVVADAKSLMEKAPHWQKEMSRRAGEGRGLFDLGLAAYLFDPEDGDYSWKRLAGLAQISDPGLGRGGLGVGALAWDSRRVTFCAWSVTGWLLSIRGWNSPSCLCWPIWKGKA